MKKFLLPSLVLLFAANALAQVNVSPTGDPAHPDAGLEVRYTDKGLLPPRVALETTELAAPLSEHVQGMVVYNTTTGGGLLPGLYVNNGSLWTPLAAAPGGLPSGDDNTVLTLQGGMPVWDKLCRPGMTGPAGGKIFHCYGDFISQGGFEASDENVELNDWGCPDITILTSKEVGTGSANTAAILVACSDPGSAAAIASEYEQGGYSDWFLPSQKELELMHNQMYLVGGMMWFSSSGRWYSSSAHSDYDGIYIVSNNADGTWLSGEDYHMEKTEQAFVRPIRQF